MLDEDEMTPEQEVRWVQLVLDILGGYRSDDEGVEEEDNSCENS